MRGVDRLAELLHEAGPRRMSTLPADLPPTPAYVRTNESDFGIDPLRAERAAWTATSALRFNLLPGFALLGIARPGPRDRRAMLLFAHDRRDGSGSRLHGAWWVDPDAVDPALALSRLVVDHGIEVRCGNTQGLFVLHTPQTAEPVPVRRGDAVEVHGLPQSEQFTGPAGWAFCFAVDRFSYGRALLERPGDTQP